MESKLKILGIPAVIVVGGLIAAATFFAEMKAQPIVAETALAAKFEDLSKNSNSSCTADFTDSIKAMGANDQIRGSCCSPMSRHHYEEQLEGLKKYTEIPEIPTDPYDVNGELAKELLAYYDYELSPDEQATYDYAMVNSHEKGPCCCKCWHWYVYGGLAKKLIHERGFTGAQIAEVWDLSDGCGGEGHDHAEYHME